MANSQLEILSGWKQIADHLGKGVRTVRRYERELSLTVRRPAGKSSVSVIATADELDAWVTTSPIRSQFELARPTANTEMLEELRRNVREMSRLRRETQEVRHGISESLELLRTNIRSAMPGNPTFYESGPRVRADVLPFVARKRKTH